MDQKFSKLRFKELAAVAAVGSVVALHTAGAMGTPVNIGSGTGVLNITIGNGIWFLNNAITFQTTSSNWGFSSASLVTASGTRNDAFDGAQSWLINGPAPLGGYVSPGGTVDITPYPIDPTVGTTVTGAPQTLAGLTVTGQMYFSPVKAVVRSMVIMQNQTGADITVTVENASNLGSDSNTFYQATSSGDANYDPSDNWVVTSQHAVPTTADDPILTTAFSQAGAPDRPTPNPTPANGSDKIYNFYTVTVPAGQTRRLMNFVQMSDTVAHAVADAAVFNSNAALQRTDYLSGLTPAQQKEIVNWTNLGPIAPAVAVPALSGWALAGMAWLLGLVGLGGMGLFGRRRARTTQSS